MNYIVLDMEWNQSYPKEDDSRKKKVKNEIIEIGAIKLNESLECVSGYKRLVRPVFIKKLNSHVKKLTGITKEMLMEGGFFPEVIDEFREWCGEDMCIITWGYDDIPMLVSCLKMYGLEHDWIGKCYNLQVIFNAQTDGGTNQRSLKSALEHFGVAMDEEHPWHDALNDAYYTAVICRHLDLQRGIEEYDERTKGMVPVSSLMASLKEVGRRQYRCKVVNGLCQSGEAFSQNLCPICSAPMVRGAWASTGKGRLVTIGECKTHGRFFIQLRLVAKSETEKLARKIFYESTSEAESYYSRKLKKNVGKKTGREVKKTEEN